MAEITLAQAQTELANAKAALEAARLSQSYTQGDKQTTRATIEALTRDVTRLARQVRELTAAGAGADNPGILTPSWQ